MQKTLTRRVPTVLVVAIMLTLVLALTAMADVKYDFSTYENNAAMKYDAENPDNGGWELYNPNTSSIYLTAPESSAGFGDEQIRKEHSYSFSGED